jgi:hypothetical protein
MKTKSFDQYLRKRLTKAEIAKIKAQARFEIQELRKSRIKIG